MSDDEKVGRDQVDALLREFYAARGAGDLPALCSLFAGEAVFEISATAQARPIMIRTRGAAGYRPWLALLLKIFRVTDLQLVLMIIDGPNAAVRWRANIHSKVTGATVATELVDLIEIRDGKIASYIEFVTPSAATDSARSLA